jgi:hypothetical protein
MTAFQKTCETKGDQTLMCFRSGHSTVTATLKVLNGVHCALDRKLHCVFKFIDLSKAFDTVDHVLEQGLLVMLWSGLNCLPKRTQCVKADGCKSDSGELCSGVPQGSILGSLFII